MLEEKIAVVTGASRGIGRAIAKELALKGAFVIVNYNGSKQAADETVNEITQAGGKAVGVQCNVAGGSRSVQCFGLQRGGGVLKGHYQPL